MIKKTLFALLIWVVTQLSFGFIIHLLRDPLRLDWLEVTIYGSIASNIAMVLIFWLIRYFRAKELYKPVTITTFALSLIFGLCAITGVGLLLDPIDVNDYLEDTFRAMSNSFAGFLSICIVAPIAEEILMRRIVLTNMRKLTKSKWWGIIISASIFSLIHINPAQIVGALPAGIILGWLYCETRSLFVPICLHIANNTLSLALMRMGLDDEWPLGEPRTIITIASCAVISTLTCWLLVRYNKRRTRASKTVA